MIRNSDITVVVQGPVQALPDRDQDEGITQQCLSSVREILPGARIVLSTWDKQELDGLDYDELVINTDPGINIIGYWENGEPRKENYNRQIVSTVGGLRRVQSKYAMKLRADNFLTGDQFKALQTRFQKHGADCHFSRERVVVNNTFTRLFAKGLRVAFHSCDFFYFGLSEDVLDMWDLPLFDDYEYDPAKKGQVQHEGAPHYNVDVCQELWLRFLNKHLAEPIELHHLHDFDAALSLVSDQSFANNLVIGGPEDIGLGLPSKFGRGTRATRPSRLMAYASHQDWQRMYRRHCDPEFSVEETLSGALRAALWRYAYMPMRGISGRLTLAKKRRRYRI